MSRSVNSRRTKATRAARLAPWALGLAVLAGSGAAIGQSSYAAFSSTTENAGNNWKAGAVTLTDDDTNLAAFSATGLKPGDTGSKCIKVTSTADLDGQVRMYSAAHATTKALSDNIDLTVTLGNGGSFGDCTGFVKATDVYSGTLAAFATGRTNYANSSAGSWNSVKTDSRTYQISYKVKDSAPNTVQGGTSNINFNWELQSGTTAP
jgi:hypothetical protein